MKHFDLLVIGGVAGGMSAASQARRIRRDISIGVFEKNDFVSYGACGMPYFIGGLIDKPEKLVAIDKDKFIKERNIQIFTKSFAEKVDFIKKQVSVNHEDDVETYTYDKLVIATGARPVVPPISGAQGSNVFYLRNLNEAITIRNFIETRYPEKAVIIGGGPIGLEMAESFRRLNIETIILEKADRIAAAFDSEIRELILNELEKNSIKTILGADINKIENNGSRLIIKYNNQSVDADFVLVSSGIRPNTGFLKNTDLKMNSIGAIIVNEKSETNIPGVYAAGDCATVKHLITGEDVYMPLGTTANKQGRVAGLQALGISGEKFKGVVGSQLIKVFDLETGKTGLSEEDAKRYGIPAKSAMTQGHSRAEYYPGALNLFIKLTINSNTAEIIGGQTAGIEGAALRCNIIATAIANRMKIEDFAYLDLGYAPSFSPVWDALLATGQKLVDRR